MSEPSEPKPYEIFTRARKASIVETTSPATMVANEASGMASTADVLAELKSVRLDFGSKLDNINNHLSDVVNSIVATESKLSDAEQDVVANTTRIGEAETRIATTEDKLQHTQEALGTQPLNELPILNQKLKIWKIDAEERTCGFLVYLNKLKEISHSSTLKTTCYRDDSAVLIKLSLWSKFIAHWHGPNLTRTKQFLSAF